MYVQEKTSIYLLELGIEPRASYMLRTSCTTELFLYLQFAYLRWGSCFVAWLSLELEILLPPSQVLGYSTTIESTTLLSIFFFFHILGD
jgi:hypothetical protein